jgi:hypothetical protein
LLGIDDVFALFANVPDREKNWSGGGNISAGSMASVIAIAKHAPVRPIAASSFERPILVGYRGD